MVLVVFCLWPVARVVAATVVPSVSQLVLVVPVVVVSEWLPARVRHRTAAACPWVLERALLLPGQVAQCPSVQVRAHTQVEALAEHCRCLAVLSLVH